MTVNAWRLALAGVLFWPLVGSLGLAQQQIPRDLYDGYDWQVPNHTWMTPAADEMPIYFVSRSQNLKEWTKLTSYWNEGTEKTTDPFTGEPLTRKVLKIKVPLGLSQGPPVPAENPMTAARWALGRDLYFDPVLSSDGTVSCASCHDPRRGYTDQAPVSVGISGQKGGVSAPTVLNSGYNAFQFWDGRAKSLEDQAQGPVGNPIEMFDGKGHAWYRSIARVRAKGDYTARFKKAFGTLPTRDAIAKAIAIYERTVLSGNALVDRAELAARVRVSDDGGSDFNPKAEDFALVLRAALKKQDPALKMLGAELDDDKAINKVAASLARGRALFFGKARCATCHAGDNYTDNSFHNLGVGVGKDGKIPRDAQGRFAQLPTGAKDFAMLGAWKTPTLRGLVGTGPYMHTGAEKTLAEVVEFYDRGGNPNEFLSNKMRDETAERVYEMSRRHKTPYQGPKPFLFGPDQRPIIPLKLNLTKQDKADLVLFLRALEGEPVDAFVADPKAPPPFLKAR